MSLSPLKVLLMFYYRNFQNWSLGLIDLLESQFLEMAWILLGQKKNMWQNESPVYWSAKHNLHRVLLVLARLNDCYKHCCCCCWSKSSSVDITSNYTYRHWRPTWLWGCFPTWDYRFSLSASTAEFPRTNQPNETSGPDDTKLNWW